MALTTGPVELERWFKQGEPVNIVDVRATEDYAEGGISLAHSICRRASGTTPRS
jgi:rhodanese-related sulfurtransferase